MKRKTNEDFQKEVINLTKGEYTFLEPYGENNQQKLLCRHNKCGFVYSVSLGHFLCGRRCPQCYKKTIKSQETFKKEVQEIGKGEYIFLEEYLNDTTKILCQHKCGYQWKIKPSHFLQGHGCPRCKKVEKYSQKEFEEKVRLLTNGEIKVKGEYVNARTPILFEHLECKNEWKARPTNILSGKGCPKCKSSRGEKKIMQFLENNKIFFISQYAPSWNTNRRYRYDFYLPTCEMIVEYHGIQHYEEVDFFRGTLKDRQKNDKIKQEQARKRKIRYIIIPYWDYENIEKILAEVLTQTLHKM